MKDQLKIRRVEPVEREGWTRIVLTPEQLIEAVRDYLLKREIDVSGELKVRVTYPKSLYDHRAHMMIYDKEDIGIHVRLTDKLTATQEAL